MEKRIKTNDTEELLRKAAVASSMPPSPKRITRSLSMSQLRKSFVTRASSDNPATKSQVAKGPTLTLRRRCLLDQIAV